MPEFKINAVSQEVRSFETKFGQMKSYKLKLEGVESVVELAQKDTTPAPVQGQTLTGTVDYTGQYGPKFKKENPQYGGGGGAPSGGGRPAFQAKDSLDIHAQFAIREANLQVVHGAIEGDELEAKANDFFDMIERVKNHKETDNGFDPSVASNAPVAIPVDDAFNSMSKVDDEFSKPVDLADIPFN